MKITKEYLKKLVREAVEEEMGSGGESGEGRKGVAWWDKPDSSGKSSGSDLLDKLKKRLKTMEGSDESGYGGWDESSETQWYYDDAEGGYYNVATVNWRNPVKIEVTASEQGYREKKKAFPLKKETDVDDIIKFVETYAGLRESDDPEDEGPLFKDEPEEEDEGPLFKDEPEEEDEGMLKESVKRKFALLANIKLNEGMEEAPKEEPLEASFPVDYGFSTNKRGIWLTVDEGGKLFVQFGGRIPAEKFFGKDLKPQDFQLKNDGDQHQISDNPMFRPSGDPLKSAQEERYRVLKKGKK